jgi:alpha-glucoside transport system permease protein
VEHPALPQRAGGGVTSVAETVRRPALRTSERVVAFLGRAPIHVALIGIAIVWLVPSVGLLVTSFRERPDIAATGWWTALGNASFTFENYDFVLDSAEMAPSFLNSILITVPATLLPLTIGALAAYAFAWISFPFRDTIFLSIVALMIVPIQMALVPILRLIRDLGIGDSFVGIWLAHTAFGLPLAIFLLRNFFITLPRDLIEAARVDGASNLRIFLRVVLPLSVPALASFAIFQFLWVWNDLLMALVFINNSDLLPLTVRITQMQSTYGVEWHLLSAGAFVLMIVPLMVFFALQRYFVQGLLAGSVK